jgi:hypothetical protein
MGGMRDASSPRSVNANLRTGRPKRPSRPSTAEGREFLFYFILFDITAFSDVWSSVAPRDMNLSLSSDQSDQSMQSMRSASALGYQQADSNPYYQQPIPTLSVSDAEDDHAYQPSSATETYILRSRTPTGDRDIDPKASFTDGRMASLDGMGYVDDDFGASLYRVSTAPSPAARLPPIQAQGRSAKKLSKMGISVADQAGINVLPPGTAHSGKKFNPFRFFKGGKP